MAVGEAAWRRELRRLEARHGVSPLAAWLGTAAGGPGGTVVAVAISG